MNAIGVLRYSPKLHKSKCSENWWLVADVDPSLGQYLRQLYSLSRWRTDILRRPAWEAHITIIRNEKPPKQELWEKYASLEVEFSYDLNEANGNDVYVWIPVVCERMLDVREELGLSRNPSLSLHLTIGNRK